MKTPSNTEDNTASPVPRAPTSLTAEAERAGIVVTERIKDRLAALVVTINLAIITIIAGLALFDAVLLAEHVILPADRIITIAVVLSLISAGAAQVGVIGVIIARNAFRNLRNEPKPHFGDKRVTSARQAKPRQAKPHLRQKPPQQNRKQNRSPHA